MKSDSTSGMGDFSFLDDTEVLYGNLGDSELSLWKHGDKSVRAGRLLEAKQAYEAALAINDANPMVRNNLERVYQILEVLGEQSTSPSEVECGWTLSLGAIQDCRTSQARGDELRTVLSCLPSSSHASLDTCELPFYAGKDHILFWESVLPFTVAMKDKEMSADADARRSALLLQSGKVALAFGLWRDFAFRMCAYSISVARQSYHSGRLDECLRLYEAFFRIASFMDRTSYCPAVLKAIAKPSLLFYVRARVGPKARYLSISDLLKRKPYRHSSVRSLARAFCQWNYTVQIFQESAAASIETVTEIAAACQFETRQAIEVRTSVAQLLLANTGAECAVGDLHTLAATANRLVPNVSISSEELDTIVQVRLRKGSPLVDCFHRQATQVLTRSAKGIQLRSFSSPYQFVSKMWPQPIAATALMVQVAADSGLRVSHQKDLIMGWIRLSALVALSFLQKEHRTLPEAAAFFITPEGVGKNLSDGIWCELLVAACRGLLSSDSDSQSAHSLIRLMLDETGERSSLAKKLFEYVQFRNKVLAHGITSSASQYSQYFMQHQALVDVLARESQHLTEATWLVVLSVDITDDAFRYEVLDLTGPLPHRRTLQSHFRLRQDTVFLLTKDQAVDLGTWVRYTACPICGHDRVLALDKLDPRNGRIEYQSLSCATSHKLKDPRSLDQIMSFFNIIPKPAIT